MERCFDFRISRLVLFKLPFLAFQHALEHFVAAVSLHPPPAHVTVIAGLYIEQSLININLCDWPFDDWTGLVTASSVDIIRVSY